MNELYWQPAALPRLLLVPQLRPNTINCSKTTRRNQEQENLQQIQTPVCVCVSWRGRISSPLNMEHTLIVFDSAVKPVGSAVFLACRSPCWTPLITLVFHAAGRVTVPLQHHQRLHFTPGFQESCLCCPPSWMLCAFELAPCWICA